MILNILVTVLKRQFPDVSNMRQRLLSVIAPWATGHQKWPRLYPRSSARVRFGKSVSTTSRGQSSSGPMRAAA